MKFKYRLLSYTISLCLGSGSAISDTLIKPNIKPFLLFESFSSASGYGRRIAGDGTRRFITIWKELGSGIKNNNNALYGRYSNNGFNVGDKFKIVENSYTADFIVGNLSVAMNPQGNAVACWIDGKDYKGTQGLFDETQILCRLIPANTTPNHALPLPIPVNTPTISQDLQEALFAVSVAMDDSGNFIVVWLEYDPVNKNQQVMARRYAADGSAKTEEFEIAPDSSEFPSVAMDQDGDAVVVWASIGASNTIYARRVDKDSNVPQEKFKVDLTPADDNDYNLDNKGIDYTVFDPTVAMDAAGDFAVTWERQRKDTKRKKKCHTYRDDDGQKITDCDYEYSDANSLGIVAQRFDQTGTRLNSEDIMINVKAKQHHWYPEIDMDTKGNFVVTWEQELYKKQCFRHFPDDEEKVCEDVKIGSHIFTRRYNSAENKLEGIQTVIKKNTKTPINSSPSVALTEDGSFEVMWTGTSYTKQVDDGYTLFESEHRATAKFYPAKKK